MLRDGRGDVVAKLVPRVVRVRADHREGTQRLAQGKQLVFVLEQDDGLPCGLEGEVLMCRLMNGLDRVLGIDQGLFKEAQAELLLEDPPHAAVDQAHGHFPCAHAVQQVEHVARLERDSHIHTRGQGQCSRFLLRGRQSLVDERADPAPLRQNQAVEAQLLSEDACQELFRGMRRHAVDRRIGRHDPERLRS